MTWISKKKENEKWKNKPRATRKSTEATKNNCLHITKLTQEQNISYNWLIVLENEQ